MSSLAAEAVDKFLSPASSFLGLYGEDPSPSFFLSSRSPPQMPLPCLRRGAAPSLMVFVAVALSWLTYLLPPQMVAGALHSPSA
jgi:hypothetical protein